MALDKINYIYLIHHKWARENLWGTDYYFNN